MLRNLVPTFVHTSQRRWKILELKTFKYDPYCHSRGYTPDRSQSDFRWEEASLGEY